MPKISFTKAEEIFIEALRKMFIKRLSDLATIVTLVRNPKSSISKTAREQIVLQFQNELKKIKKHDPKLYESLNLSREAEYKILSPLETFSQGEWLTLHLLQERIEELKKELRGEEIYKEEFEAQIERERKKHINKRFNVREGWLPLK